MSAQGGGDAVLWALLAVGAALLAAAAFAAVRRAMRVPDFDFSRGYDALASVIEGPRLYLVKR